MIRIRVCLQAYRKLIEDRNPSKAGTLVFAGAGRTDGASKNQDASLRWG